MQKIVLVSQQGSGTNLLRAFLNSHPDIYFYNEFFCNTRTERNWLTWDRRKDIKQFLDECFSIEYKTVGFDLKHNHFKQENIEYVNENNFKVLHLLRDIGRTFLQMVVDDGKKFDYSDLVKHRKTVVGYIKRAKEVFSKLDWMDISYEEMTLGRTITELPIEFEKKILDFLEVDYRKLFIEKEGTAEYKLKVRF